MNYPIICPQCGRDDMAQKVSGLYEAGLSTGTYRGTERAPLGIVPRARETLTGTSQTVLSRKLSPPRHPQSNTAYILAGGGGGFLVLVILGIALILSSRAFKVDTLLCLGGGLIPIGIGIGLVSAFWGYSSYQTYQAQMRTWSTALEVWNRLYYCSRNDCIFDPYTRQSAPTDRMDLLLYTHRS
jgi:hypothetical protein